MIPTVNLIDVSGQIEERAGVLGVALAVWARRDDAKPQPEVRQAANTAMDEIGRASCRERGTMTCRSRWSPYH